MTIIKDSVDELVSYVSCYKPRPLFFHAYIGPFVSIYSILIYQWLINSSLAENQEFWFISVIALVVLQVLSYLFCHWSVHVNCFLAYSKVR